MNVNIGLCISSTSSASGATVSTLRRRYDTGVTAAIALRSSALDAVGYNPKLYVGGVVPPQEVLKLFANLQTLYPFILSIVAVALVATLYPINDKRLREIKAELQGREEALAGAQ